MFQFRLGHATSRRERRHKSPQGRQDSTTDYAADLSSDHSTPSTQSPRHRLYTRTGKFRFCKTKVIPKVSELTFQPIRSLFVVFHCHRNLNKFPEYFILKFILSTCLTRKFFRQFLAILSKSTFRI